VYVKVLGACNHCVRSLPKSASVHRRAYRAKVSSQHSTLEFALDCIPCFHTSKFVHICYDVRIERRDQTANIA
jgi:hypothetical protein